MIETAVRDDRSARDSVGDTARSTKLHSLLRRLTGLIPLVLLAVPCDAGAQFAGSADVVFSSRYVWRGITRTTRPALQVSGLLAWLPRGWTFTTGVWASVEPFRPGASDLTDAGINGGTGEVDYWIEAHTRVRSIDVRVGHIWYDLSGQRTTIGPGSGFDTAELYAAVTYLPTRLTGIGAAFYWDHDAIDGGFATVGVLKHVPLVQARSWIVTFTPRLQAGFSMGQAFDGESGEPGYFVDNGLSYVDASAGLFVSDPKWAPYINATVQYNDDPATRVNRLGGESTKTKAWLEVGVSYTTGSAPKVR